MKKRLEEFDYAKGMAIIGVVAGHSLAFRCETFPLVPRLIEVGIFSLVIAVIPVFLFISGFLGYRSFIKRKNTKEFLLTRAKRLLPSYLIWSTIYLMLTIFFGNKVGLRADNGFFVISLKYIFGAAITPFYYLFILFVFYLMTPWLAKFDAQTLKKWFFPLSLFALISAAFFFFPYCYNKRFIPPDVAYRNPLFWILFYVWGVYWAKKIKRGERSPWENPLNFSNMAFLLLSYALAFGVNIAISSYNILGLNQLSPFVYPYYIAAVPFSLRISYLMSRNKNLRLSILKQFGLHSYGIYLSHYVILILILFLSNSISPYPVMKSTLGRNFLGWLLGCAAVLSIVTLVEKTSRGLYKIIF